MGRVQQALEELGFGSPNAAPKPKQKAKAKANPPIDAGVQQESPNVAAPVSGSKFGQDLPSHQHGQRDLVARIDAILTQCGGSIEIGMLSQACPGVKKKD